MPLRIPENAGPVPVPGWRGWRLRVTNVSRYSASTGRSPQGPSACRLNIGGLGHGPILVLSSWQPNSSFS
eukprot:9468986-Pyramimonas_sp.AAC.2